MNDILVRLQILEKKVDKMLEKMGIDIDEEEEFRTAIDYAVRTLDFSLIKAHLRKKIEREGRLNGKSKHRRTETSR
ncbi:MAG: hypothetical protein GXP46_01695 [Deferribacteres bacterium]|nr:hypothetical protein [Deferribacteres bacterium]